MRHLFHQLQRKQPIAEYQENYNSRDETGFVSHYHLNGANLVAFSYIISHNSIRKLATHCNRDPKKYVKTTSWSSLPYNFYDNGVDKKIPLTLSVRCCIRDENSMCEILCTVVENPWEPILFMYLLQLKY